MLPDSVIVFERGWLSANNVLLTGGGQTTLIDSGYCSHSGQTLSLVRSALGLRPLEHLVNTHLHSDHCGGNFLLQSTFPELETLIPPGHAEAVRRWDEVALTYSPTGQSCPRFLFDRTLEPGSEQEFGGMIWEVHAAPGHDPHSVVLFSPHEGILISGDALWENGFGVVFPELEGIHAFDAVGNTLDLIECLAPKVVIPGHGPVFTNLSASLGIARKRLEGFVHSPAKHARYAAKVLLKFKLLDVQEISRHALYAWATDVTYLGLLHGRYGSEQSLREWLDGLIAEMGGTGSLRVDGKQLLNC
nr:MBL fold metallo-hydrolase [Oxalobacteraceae bacterium]